MKKLTMTCQLAHETGLAFPFLLDIKKWHLTQNIKGLCLTALSPWGL